MLQSVSTCKTWASSAGAEAKEAPSALTYKVEIYTGDVRGAGTHVRLCQSSHARVHLIDAYPAPLCVLRPDLEAGHYCGDALRACLCNSAQAAASSGVLLQAPAAIQLIGTEGESAEFVLGELALSWRA